MSGRPLVGVSACLVGQRVRYDGKDKRDDWIASGLGGQVELVAICPEVEIGLGVPRPRIQMVAGGGLQIVDDGRELSPDMAALVASRLAELGGRLSGYVFKARSPSCGLVAPVFAGFAAGSAEVGRGPGRFAGGLLAALPDLPAVDETELESEAGRREFVARVRGYRPGRGVSSH